ncbi:LacI family DNA-binding transcriptional regulator [Robbsia sp. KACC 23696]|uniref:LacI family DNA-binding transcriptional regulator n=1 Tax=Robbsia sp. KACC 23696 TaxID=3149231 RepID=UPI00325BC48B
MTTIHDVAALAGVSASSVSNVLNGRTDKLSAKTYSRVEAAIRSLNFSPNRVARQLKTGHTSMLGLLVPSTANPMYGQLALNIEAAAQSRYGYSVLLGNTHRDKQQESRMFADMLAYGLRAVIVVSSLADEQHLNEAARNGMAVVSYDRAARHTKAVHLSSASGAGARVVSSTPLSTSSAFLHGDAVSMSGATGSDDVSRVDHISPDNFQAGYIACEHLIDRGHRHLAFLLPSATTISRSAKIAGFLARAEEGGDLGAPVLARVVKAPTADAFGDSELLDLGAAMAEQIAAMKPIPTGVVTVNDMLAIGLMSGLNKLKLKIPDDISVVGMDGLPIAAFVNPGLTSVAMPLAAMAEAMVERVIARAREPDLPPLNALFETSLVERQSVMPPSDKDGKESIRSC